jgi:hypothetical protein
MRGKPLCAVVSRRDERLLVAVVLTLTLGLAAPACSSGSATHEPPHASVLLKDFRIRFPEKTVTAGSLDLDIHNRGPSTHELVIVRTDLDSASLPLASDGLSVDEDSPVLDFVEEDSDVGIGESPVLEVRLTPGHYVLFCNLEGHYLGGMHTSLDVT